MTLVICIFVHVKKKKGSINMHNIMNISTNNALFAVLMALTPAVFAAMFLGSESIAAAIAVSVAYASVVIGERLD